MPLLNEAGKRWLSSATSAQAATNSVTAVGTNTASELLSVDANKSVDTLRTPDLRLGASGSEVQVLATGTEINRTCDVSTRLVNAGGTLSVTEALHDGKIVVFDQAAGSVCTLPAATGSGARFRFQIGTVATSNSHIVKVANASDTMVGQVMCISDDAGNTVKPFFAATTDDTITLNRSTTGSTRKGEWVELIDMATNLWHVSGTIAATGSEATPFSATV